MKMATSSREFTWLPLLADVAGSRDLAAYWNTLHALLQAIAPHHTMAACCQLSPAIFGEEARPQRNQAVRTMRETIHASGIDSDVSDEFLLHVHDQALALGLMLHEGRQAMRQACLLTPEQLRDNEEFFQRYVRPQGWEHALTLPLWWEGDELHAGVTLYRNASQGPFEAFQLESIQALLPTLGNLLQRLQEQGHQFAAKSNLQDVLTDLPVGLMLFEGDWQPVFINEEGYRQTQLWNYAPAVPPPNDARIDFRVPQELRAAGDRLRSSWLHDALGITPLKGELKERVAHPLRADLKATLTIARVKDGSSRLLALLVRYSGMASRAASAFQPTSTQLSILSQLTPSERNVALLVMRAMSNQEIAQALHRDVTTVKDHLSHIYDKLGIRGRTQLATLLAG